MEIALLFLVMEKFLVDEFSVFVPVNRGPLPIVFSSLPQQLLVRLPDGRLVPP